MAELDLRLNQDWSRVLNKEGQPSSSTDQQYDRRLPLTWTGCFLPDFGHKQGFSQKDSLSGFTEPSRDWEVITKIFLFPLFIPGVQQNSGDPITQPVV